MDLEQLQTELDKIKKENEELRQENQRLVSENNLLRQNQAKPSNAIAGFSVVKQGKYYAAAKRIKGKIHRIYLGKSKDGAETKLNAYLDKIGYKQPGNEDKPLDDVGDLFADVVENKPLSIGETIQEAEMSIAACKESATRYVTLVKTVFPHTVTDEV